MKTSVIMTSYNGSQYILPQLQSLRDQTQKADEVLIFDDLSSDSTVQIIQNFVHENRLYDWAVSVNAENKGWKRNFADAIHAARGDLIFLCDQDDIWNREKISVMKEIMENHPEIDLLASNYDVRYIGNARKIRSWMLKPYGKDELVKVPLTGRTFEPIRPGCTYVFRKEMIPLFDQVWQPQFAHDRILWDTALVKGTLYIVNQQLLTQVRHEENNTPANKIASGRTDVITHRRSVAEQLLNLPGLCEENIQWLKEYTETANLREKALNEKSVIQLTKLSVRRQYMPLPVSWMLDIYSAMKK